MAVEYGRDVRGAQWGKELRQVRSQLSANFFACYCVQGSCVSGGTGCRACNEVLKSRCALLASSLWSIDAIC